MEEDVASVRDAWDAVSHAWAEHEEELAAFTGPVSDALLELLAPAADQRVLELACGPGRLGRRIAGAVDEVVCTDVAPRMVAVAASRARAAGLDGVTCEVADAHALSYPDGSFDRVVCQFGLMLMPDPDAALRQSRRVLRRDGRLAAAVWGPAQDNLWIVMVGAALLQHGHPPAGDPTGPGGIFSLADPDDLAARVEDAGFRDVELRSVDVEATFARFEDYWDRHVATGAPLRAAVAGLGPDEVAAVRETCRTACAGFRTDDGYRFTGRALVVAGRA